MRVERVVSLIFMGLGAIGVGLVIWWTVAAQFVEAAHLAWWLPLVMAIFPVAMLTAVWRIMWQERRAQGDF